MDHMAVSTQLRTSRYPPPPHGVIIAHLADHQSDSVLEVLNSTYSAVQHLRSGGSRQRPGQGVRADSTGTDSTAHATDFGQRRMAPGAPAHRTCVLLLLQAGLPSLPPQARADVQT